MVILPRLIRLFLIMQSKDALPTSQDSDQNAEKELLRAISIAFRSAYPNIDYPKITLEEPRDFNHGDFASSLPLKCCKLVNTTPLDFATRLLADLPPCSVLEKAEFAAPGFINFTLHRDYLISRLKRLVNQQAALFDPVRAQETVIVEYSQPNIAKPLGVHHLLSTIIGQSIANTYRSLGAKVVAINYIGDWGTQFGKLIYAYKTWGERELIDRDPIPELLKLYVKFHAEAETNPAIENYGRAEFKKLEDGDPENRALLHWIKEESLKDVQKTYDLLGGVRFDLIQGEAYYEKLLAPVIAEGLKNGVFTEGEGGALVVNFPNGELPTCLVRKSDGASLYFTRDLAVIQHRIAEWAPDRMVYVVDTAQSLYLRQVFATGRLLWGENLPLLQHVEFGRMSFPEGRMSTRKGTVILLHDFLLEAVAKARAVVQGKNPDLAAEEVEKIARAVGVGAVKYSVLSQNRATNIVFSWEKMLSLEGNSAPYLQYAYARAQSLLQKASADSVTEDTAAPAQAKPILLEAETEIAIARHLARFQRVVEQSARDYKPNLIANYLYELTQSFHSFYARCPVLSSTGDTLRTRICLVRAVARVLKTGLELLGIEVHERM